MKRRGIRGFHYRLPRITQASYGLQYVLIKECQNKPLARTFRTINST